MDIPPKTYIGAVNLSVENLERSGDYYRRVLGLDQIYAEPGKIEFGAGERVLLRLFGQPGAQRKPNATGLYHFALRVSSRLELARTLRHLSDTKAYFVGFADHHVSEALYLADPDGHGIEIYRDRPREDWLDEQGRFKMTTDPLDIQGLVEELSTDSRPWQGIDPQTDMGHIHLQVDNIPRARDFYTQLLGFEVMADMGSASFLSAGGYHHHIGMNTWTSAGGPPAPEDSLHLLEYEIIVPDADGLKQVMTQFDMAHYPYTRENGSLEFKDPAQIEVMLKLA
jgi:catechol 2,3-dioxygenase